MKKLMLTLCAVASLTLFFGFANVSDAANSRASFNRGYRTGVRTINRVNRAVGVPVRVRGGYYGGSGYYNRGYYNGGYYNPGYYNRGYYGRGYYGGGYYGRGYYGGPGLYIRF